MVPPARQPVAQRLLDCPVAQRPLDSPVAQRLLDCSDRVTEVCGLVSVQLFVRRAPSALVIHDGSGPTADRFLARILAGLDGEYPGVLVAAAHLDKHEPRGRLLDIGETERAGPRHEVGPESLGSVLGLGAAEVAGLIATARALHAGFTPTLPEPAVIGPPPEGTVLEAASSPSLRVSGYLLTRRARCAALFLHDADPADSRGVDGYLSSLLDRLPDAGGWELAERSLRDRGEAFCRVVGAGMRPVPGMRPGAGMRPVAGMGPGAGMRPVARREPVVGTGAGPTRLRSTGSITPAAAAALIGATPGELARLVDRIRRLRHWRSPFSGVRPLPGMSSPPACLPPGTVSDRRSAPKGRCR
jgi:hypothetical protein